MATVTFIVGLCGSGKSHMVQQMTDVHIIDERFFERQYELLDAIRAGKNCAIAEIAFCKIEMREKIVRELSAFAPDIDIKWICFENNLAKANSNCRTKRKDKEAGSEERHVAINQSYSPDYTYPSGAEILPIWTPHEIKDE